MPKTAAVRTRASMRVHRCKVTRVQHAIVAKRNVEACSFCRGGGTTQNPRAAQPTNAQM